MYNPQGKPYQDIYIYYLKGIFDSHTRFPAEHFIGNWEEDGFSFLFFDTASEPTVQRLIASQTGVTLVDQYTMRYDEWLGEKPQPVRIGNFAIIPPWHQDARRQWTNRAERTILLDPGVVFGTGTHATTRDCLAALEAACALEHIHTAIDLGSGTGLLSIAAVKSGCERVLAVDLNFLAVQTTRDNIELNGLNGAILPVHGSALDLIACPAELLIANIHYDVMKRLLVANGFMAKRYFILSGLLRSQARAVENLLGEMPVRLLEKWNVNGIWHTYMGKVERL